MSGNVFVRNGVQYAHASATLTLTPKLGANEAIPITLKHIQSFKYDLGAGSEVCAGTQIAPVGIVATAAKPNVEIGLSTIAQSREIANHFGPGAVQIPCDGVVSWQQAGLPTFNDEFEDCMLTKGLGGESDAGSAPKDSIGGNCVTIKPAGIDVLGAIPT